MDYLFRKVDNSKLIFFRIFFGLLMMFECWGAIATGWVKETFIEPKFTFNFIGFDWTQQVFVGESMLYIYGIMGFLGLLIMLGALYRVSITSFCILWSLTYFMQKSHYNNHYYLIMVVSFLMALMPANRYLSIDANIFTGLKSTVTEKWNYILFKSLIACVYIYAAIAKISPGWVDNHFLPLRLNRSAIWFENEFGQNFFSDFLRERELAEFLAYAGIGFDFLIVPLLLIKPTRKIAFILGMCFHLFNSLTLHIGIFPYFALVMSVFFFSSKEINKLFFPFKKTDDFNERSVISPLKRRLTMFFVVGFISIQMYLPIRHWFILGDVLWTEEGHRMAWRMMLRTKTGSGNFEIQLPDKTLIPVNVYDYLTLNQISSLYTKPDMIWQFAQKLKKEYKKEGKDIKVFYKNGMLKINDGPFHSYINPDIDLANTKWSYFGHQKWILPEPKDYYDTKK